MTSITAQTHATLDGVIDAPPADALLQYISDAGRQGALDLALAADTLLLPRETWQGLARASRDQTGPMAERLNAMPKYVVSACSGPPTSGTTRRSSATTTSPACASANSS